MKYFINSQTFLCIMDCTESHILTLNKSYFNVLWFNLHIFLIFPLCFWFQAQFSPFSQITGFSDRQKSKIRQKAVFLFLEQSETLMWEQSGNSRVASSTNPLAQTKYGNSPRRNIKTDSPVCMASVKWNILCIRCILFISILMFMKREFSLCNEVKPRELS